jgi:hypothetical protein
MSETRDWRRSKALWVTLAIVIFVIVAFLVAFVLGAFRGTPQPAASPTPTVISIPTPSVSSTRSATPTPTPTTDAPLPPSADRVQHFAEAISSGNTAALEGDLAAPVNVILYGTECCGSVSPVDAINTLGNIEDDLTATWDFAPSAATLDGYRAGPYAEYFPVNAVVGISNTGHLVSFTLDPSGTVTTLFISGVTAL